MECFGVLSIPVDGTKSPAFQTKFIEKAPRNLDNQQKLWYNIYQKPLEERLLDPEKRHAFYCWLPVGTFAPDLKLS